MLPLKDDVPSQRLPVVTVALILVNLLAYLYQFSLQASGDAQALRAAQDFVLEFGLVPCRLSGQCAVAPDFPQPALSIFTAMFLHGGWLHLAGNMLYLWIFGDNIEDELGHARFLLFYLLSGVVAALAQTAIGPGSTVPMIGASGAVSGVLAAYLLLFPYARVLTLITFGFFVRFVYVPAVIVLGFWIVVQFVNGLVTFGAGDEGLGGVAWFAHLGGFAAGLGLLYLLRPRPLARL